MTPSISRLKIRLIAVLLVSSLFVSGNAQTREPNIILILTDDQGWSNTSVQMKKGMPDSRSDFFQTPALEKMAKRGMVFSQSYAPAPTCTPTRTSIQFGKTPARLRNTIVNDVIAKKMNYNLSDEQSLHQLIKNVNPGYTTAHFGKWGVDVRKPEYDFGDGNTNNGEGDWAIPGKEKLPPDNPKRTNEVTKSALHFLEKQAGKDKPFFMQVSYYAVHVSYDAQKSTIAKYRNLPKGKYCIDADYGSPPPPNNDWMLMYAAMTEELDYGLASILEKLEALNIDENTYVIYISDNGACFRGNQPLSGGKGTIWEGGLRVPTVVTGPKVKKGSYCDIPIAGWDFYATINDIIGGNPLPPEYDGGSLLNVFERGNKGNIKRSVPGLIFHFPWYGHTMPASAIVDGNMKLVMNLHTGETKLFDLEKDISERIDLSMKFPKRSATLKEKLESYLKDVQAESLEAMYDARAEQIDGEIERAKSETHITQIKRKYDWVNESKADTSWRFDYMEAFDWEKYNARVPDKY